MINWLKGSRLLSKTPKLFAWIRNACASGVVTCGGLLATPQYLPDGFDGYLKQAIVGFTITAFVAQLTSTKHDNPNTTTNG